MPEDQQAQDQAEQHGSFARSAKVRADDGTEFTVRNPLYFHEDQLTAYHELHHRMNKCDRWPDIEKPEQRMETSQPDGTVVKTFIGAHVQRGDYIEPYQEDGMLVTPPYEVQVSKIALGEEEYGKFKAAGGSPREVVDLLAELRRGIANRVESDSKSDGGGRVLAAVPAPDSV